MRSREIVFPKIKDFRKKMFEEQIAVYSYRYRYNCVRCFVAVCLLTDEDKKCDDAEYALIKLRFMREEDINDFVACYANSVGLLGHLGKIRRFFNIPFAENGMRAWLINFCRDFNEKFPTNIARQDDRLTQISVRIVCEQEGLDPEHTYRRGLIRHNLPGKNGKVPQRRECNSQLAQQKYPKLWSVFRNDKTVSFSFTDDPEAEQSEEEVYRRFVENEASRDCLDKKTKS